MLDGDRGPAPRDAVERLDLIEPFALDHALLEVEARRGLVAGRPAPVSSNSTGMPQPYAGRENKTRT